MVADVDLFSLDRVTVGGTDRPRLHEVTATIPRGTTAILGASGSGKSTLLRCLNRLEVPDAGTVRFRADDLRSVDPVGLRRRVGMVFQRPVPFDGTVLDNLRVACPGLDRDEAAHLLGRTRLERDLVDRDARELSGGESQRMCIARTLATRPEVLLLDEPTASLDAGARDALERLVGELVGNGLDAVWVTHDPDQLHRVAQHVLVLDLGSLVHAGPVATFAADAPACAARILGDTGGDGGDD